MPEPNAPLFPYTVDGRLVGARLTQFGTGSAELLPAHKEWLTRYFVPKMKQNPGAWIDLAGSASRVGNADANKALSGLRIDAVADFIKQLHPAMNIQQRIKEGADDAASFNIDPRNNDGYWRSVLILWYGVQMAKVDVPDYPPVQDPPLRFRTYKAPPGCWCIVSVDTFGLPIKAGFSGGKLSLTLLNDQGEKWIINGYGGGAGVGINVGPEIAEEGWQLVVKGIKEIGVKAGDLANVSSKIKDLNLTGPSETDGGVFRRLTWSAGLTIQQIVGEGWITIGSGELQMVALGGEEGLIYFGPVLTSSATSAKIPVPNPVQPFLAAIDLAGGTPWGFYSSLGLGTLKAALGASCTQYRITSYHKDTSS